jgi:enoyl-CoA hydratase/carnithine racemase
MAYEELIYAVENKNVAVITLNRPDAMNALTYKTHAELAQAVDEGVANQDIRVIIVTGAGRGFCAGDDVKVIFGGGEAPRGDPNERYRTRLVSYLQSDRLTGGASKLLTINKPTIAAVNGAAVGYGCDLALMCDMRIASDRARFGEAFLRVGLIPDEAQILLPRLVGLAKAYELILTTDIIDAPEAYRIGLVNKVVPHEQLMSAALELAGKIASKPPISVQLAKEGIRKGLNMPLDEWKQWYSMAFAFCQTTEDHREGARAFVEKREPHFKGK